MVAEMNSDLGEALGEVTEFLADRSPAGGVHLPHLGWDGGHIKVGEAEGLAGVDHRLRTLPQGQQANMRLTHLHAACRHFRRHDGSVIEM